jgi:hypothetical protein
LFFEYIDAQRDLLGDLKIKSSPLGKMLSSINYSQSDIEALEKDFNAFTIIVSIMILIVIALLLHFKKRRWI